MFDSNDTIPTFHSFKTYELCINETQNCYSHGSCLGEKDLFYCYCDSFYDLRSMCFLNFFQEMKGADTWYWVLGFIFTVLAFLYLCMEVALDIRFVKHTLPNFFAKLFLIAYCITKFIHYGIRVCYTINEVVYPPSFVYGVVNLLSYAAWMGSYNVVLMVWLGLYIRLSLFNKKRSAFFDYAKLVLKIMLGVYIILIIIFIILYCLPSEQDTTTFIYVVVTVIYLAILLIWSSYHCIQIHISYQLSDTKMKSSVIFLRKNKLIAALNIVLVCDIITFILSITLEQLFITPLGNLINDAVNFAIEWCAVFLMISVLQTYSLFGKNPCQHWFSAITGPTPPPSMPTPTKPTSD